MMAFAGCYYVQMDTYNYIATVHKPTVATHSTVGNFTSTEHLNLLVGKHNRIEIYDYVEGHLRLLKEFPVNGGITTLKLLRHGNQARDFLFLGTERYDTSSFRFYVLTWDAATKDLITRDRHELLDHIGEGDKICIFNHDCSLIGLRSGQPLNSIKFIHLTPQGRIEVDFGIRFDIRQDVLFSEWREILDIQFLHNSERILAVLYKVDQNLRKVATYEITANEDFESDDDIVYDSHKLVKGPWSSNARNGAKVLIPVPLPFDGVLAVGDKSISHCSQSTQFMPFEEQFLQGFVFENLRNEVECIGLRYDYGDIVHGAIGTDRLSFLFSGQNGKLQMLFLTQDDKKNTQLELKLVGETSSASTLSYLYDGIVYVGSRSGDSKLIKLNLERIFGGDYPAPEELETFLNLGPVSDCCVAVLDHRRQLVTCSGGYNDGSLRILRKEFQMKEQSSSDWPAIEGMWCLKLLKNDKYDALLVVSLLDCTEIIPGDALNFNTSDIVGFIYTDRTLLSHNVVDSIVTQVTSTSVRLVCLRSRLLLHEWKPPISHKIIRASADDTEVLIAAERGHLYYLEVIDNTLQLKETKKLEYEITSLAVGLTRNVVVGTWTQNSIMLYSLPKLTVQSVKNLEAQPRSLLICLLEGISYLFCGTADGNVVYFILDTATGGLTGMKTISFGMRPVTLQFCKNTRRVFIASDQPAFIYSSSKNLHISSVSREGINHICSVSTSLVPSGLAIATDDKLTIEALYDMKTDVHSIHLNEQPLCIAYQRQSQTFTVACVKSSEFSEMSNIHLLNALTFDILDTCTLEPYQKKGVIYGVSLLSCEFFGDDQEYVCVGTAGSGFTDGRIMVFDTREKRLELVTQTAILYGGPLFCMSAFNGMLVAGYGSTFAIFQWDNGRKTLLQVYMHKAVGRVGRASSLQCQGNFIFGGSLAQLMHLKEGSGIESLAHNVSHSSTAVDILKAGVYVGATGKQTLLFFRRNESGLDVVGQYDLGDQVSRFSHGTLVSAGEIPTTLFSTINGGIGLLACLPAHSYGVLERLQGLLRGDFNNQADDGWRLNYRKIQPEGSNILDGDLIKSFSDMKISKKSAIAHWMGMSIEDIDNKVKEVAHLH